MTELIIHAGFPKTGSSSIQYALAAVESRLVSRKIFQFHEGFGIYNESSNPLLHDLERHKTSAIPVTNKIITAITEFNKKNRIDNGTYIISSENLNNFNFPCLFNGISDIYDTKIVFYIRPQHNWLASAWKQFELPRGKPLLKFLNQALTAGYPHYWQQIRLWKETHPKAQIIIRFLNRNTLFKGEPSYDFLHLLGASELLDSPPKIINPSFDYAVLHALLRFPDLFKDKTPHEIFSEILQYLPPEYRKLNIELLDYYNKTVIQNRFSDENKEILSFMIPDSRSKREWLYDVVFKPDFQRDEAYTDLSSLHLEKRFKDVVMKSINYNPKSKVFWDALY